MCVCVCLFVNLARWVGGGGGAQVRVSYLEVYEERVYDLLDVSNRDKPVEEWATVSLLADAEGNLVLKGLTTFDVENEGERKKLLFIYLSFLFLFCAYLIRAYLLLYPRRVLPFFRVGYKYVYLYIYIYIRRISTV